MSPRSSVRLSFIEPELATLVAEPPAGSAWLHEVKFDGYRLECLLNNGRARLLTRRGLDWTDHFPRIATELAGLPARHAVLDGEVVAVLPDGRSSFQALQQALLSEGAHPLVYYAFDLLRLDQEDLRPLALLERKQRLAGLFKKFRNAKEGRVRYSDHVIGRGTQVLQRACKLGLEGIVSKRSDAPYRSGRTRDWLKVKCSSRQELVVVGFTEPKGGRKGIGALVLAVHDGSGKLVYAGKVGTGMNDALLRELRKRLEPLERSGPPIPGRLKGGLGQVHWVEPKLVVEVEFTEWTADGRLRHPSFVGLREDKPAREVQRELPA